MKRFALLFALTSLSCLAADQPLAVTLQSRTPAGAKQAVAEKWQPEQTAMIVCDMWDLHHCKNAVTREGEMAPRMNEVLEKARGQGVLIIHAPSSCMKAYEGTPARERAKTAPTAARLPDKIGEWCRQIPAEEQAVYPLDQTDGGEDDAPAEHAAWAAELAGKGLNPKAPWTRQIDVLRIDQEKDVISDSGVEIWNVLEARGIRNVVLMGVHLNMCVSGRPFGLRQMAKNGKHVALMRDMTDTMYNPLRWPFVSHQRGTELFVAHVEKRICPTITSENVIGGAAFTFSQATAGPKRLQVMLLGDSTTEASIPKKLAADEPQFEDSVRVLLASEPGLPPCDVYNEGVSGEFIRRLIDSGRYEKAVGASRPLDYIFVRYGINDQARREDYKTNFPKDYHELLARLRKDHPEATIIPMTSIPYSPENTHAEINALVAQVAAEEKLPLFDIAPRYLAELKKGPDMLNYRRFSLSKVPDRLKAFVTPYVQPGPDPQVEVLDNRLDGILGDLPGWTSDRHPSLAGYNVIADETAKFLAPLIRAKTGLKAQAAADPMESWRAGVALHPVAPTTDRHVIHSYFNTSPESPDGKYVLYYTSGTPEGEEGDLRVLERATGKERIVARGIHTEDAHRVACQQWCNNGQTIVYHDNRDGRWFVMAIDLASGKQTTLAEDRQVGYGSETQPWVPIYGCHWNPGAHRDLELVNVTTGEIRVALTAAQVVQEYGAWMKTKLGSDDLSIFFPVLSPDGKKVFFKPNVPSYSGSFRGMDSSKREGKVIFDLEKKKLVRLVEYWGHPAWTPDSRGILEKGNVVLDIESGKNAPRFATSCFSDHPSLSPDGKLFVTDADVSKRPYGQPGFWAIGVGPTQGDDYAVIALFDNSKGATTWRHNHPHPHFSADGKRIYFNVNEGKWTQLMVAEGTTAAATH